LDLTERLYLEAEPLWKQQLEHPFVQGLGTGTLERERFQRWLLQDYRYLQEFARVFAWAAAKAHRLESMSWYAAVLDLTLNTEMELHRTYAAEFGITPSELEAAPMWPTTRAYTDFLVRTAADGDLLDILAALLPCAWGYVYLARKLAESGPSPDNPYAEWIAQYASKEFAEALEWLRRELDQMSRALTEEKEERLRELFLTSTRYEWAFWEMCWNGEAWGG